MTVWAPRRSKKGRTDAPKPATKAVSWTTSQRESIMSEPFSSQEVRVRRLERWKRSPGLAADVVSQLQKLTKDWVRPSQDVRTSEMKRDVRDRGLVLAFVVTINEHKFAASLNRWLVFVRTLQK
jgi:hypothetical protein